MPVFFVSVVCRTSAGPIYDLDANAKRSRRPATSALAKTTRTYKGHSLWIVVKVKLNCILTYKDFLQLFRSAATRFPLIQCKLLPMEQASEVSVKEYTRIISMNGKLSTRLYANYGLAI
jgi:hypothetical protein